MSSRVFDLHDLANRVNIWYVKHRRYWQTSIDPIGPSEPLATQDGVFYETQGGDILVTQGS